MMSARYRRPLLVALLALLVLAPYAEQPLHAAAATLTFMATSTADAPDVTPGDGVCAAASGRCTLRAAVGEANAQPAGSTITVRVPAGTYRLSQGPLTLQANTIVLVGASAPTTILNGRGQQIVTVASTAHAVLTRMTLTGGNARGANGGAIHNDGVLAVLNSQVTNNTAYLAFGALCICRGGGIYNGPSGRLLVSGTTISGNTANQGGGLVNDKGTVLLAHSTISGNATPPIQVAPDFHFAKDAGDGGGIENTGAMTLSTSSVISNVANALIFPSPFVAPAGGNGGGIANFGGSLTVDATTISGNTSDYVGSGLDVDSGGVAVTNSTIANNTVRASWLDGYEAVVGNLTVSYSTISGNTSGISGATVLTGTIVANSTGGPDCTGPVPEYQGYNLDSDGSCGLTQTTDITDTDPMLGPLTNNGGPTPTMALLLSSPTVDHGGTSANGCPATDQRGVTRPQGSACDTGAYEATP